MKKLNKYQWGFSKVWNETLEDRKPRTYKPRDHVWASELGKAPVDVWLKMNGEEPTNPPNKRSLRKFEAGNIWEWLVGIILKRAGILKEEQSWVKHQYKGLLAVTGKLDYLAGGTPQYHQAENSLVEMGLPSIFIKAGKEIVNHLRTKYPNGLEDRVLEIKSASTFTFDKVIKTGKPLSNHALQLFHYLKATDMKRGIVVYVCKDDCRMAEPLITNPSPIEDEYRGYIEKLTDYYNSGERPPLEKPIEFDADEMKFSKNWRIEYSGYLTKLYGFKKPSEFADKYNSKASSWNRVLKRIGKGKDMTDNNKEKLAEMEEAGFNVEKIKKIIHDKQKEKSK